MNGLDMFNILAGIITIISSGVSIWLYIKRKQSQLIEKVKNNNHANRIDTFYTRLEATTKNISMIAVLADREEVTKKELKHIAVGQIYHLNGILEQLLDEKVELSKWKFGLPEEYLIVKSKYTMEQKDENQKKTNSIN